MLERFAERRASGGFWIFQLQAQLSWCFALEHHLPISARHSPVGAGRRKPDAVVQGPGSVAGDATSTGDTFSRGPAVNVHGMPALFVALAGPISSGVAIGATRVQEHFGNRVEVRKRRLGGR